MSEQYLVCRTAFYNCYYEKIGKEVRNITDELPFEIPNNWTWARFPSIVDFKLGKTPERHNQDYWNDAKYPWVSIADMKEKETIYVTKERISENALNKCFKSILSSSGTLIMSFKLTVGRVSILGMDAVHNEAIISIIPIYDKDNSIKNWLFNILGIITNLADQTDAIKGSTLNKDKLSSLLIPIPSISEQQRIISKLYSFEPLIKEYEEKEKQLSNLESSFESRLKASVLQYAIEGKLVKQDSYDEPASVLLERIKKEKERLIREGKIKRDKHESKTVVGDDKNYYCDLPKTWLIIKIGQVLDVYRGGSPRPIESFLTTKQDGINWVKIGDTIQGDKYIVSCKQKIIKDGLSKTRLIQPGDLLLTNSMSFGRPYISKIYGAVHDGWLVFSDFSNSFDKDYLFYLLSSVSILEQFKSTVSGAVVKNLNIDKVKNTNIPLLSKNEQTRIAKRIESIFLTL